MIAVMAFRPSVSVYIDDISDMESVFTRSRQDTDALLNDPMMKMK